MKLKQFKKGDLIHRTKPSRTGDSSFITTPVMFLGIKQGIFFYKYFDEPGIDDDLCDTELARYDDNYWKLYPTSFVEKLKKYVKSLASQKPI